MSLALIGVGASCEFRWRRWALLRDVLEVHLHAIDHAAFLAIGQALGGSTIRISAKKLEDEMRAIRKGLADRSIDDLVLGPITARVLYPRAAVIAPRALTRQESHEITPIGDSHTLEQYFATLVDSILDVCAHPADDGTIEVVDG